MLKNVYTYFILSLSRPPIVDCMIPWQSAMLQSPFWMISDIFFKWVHMSVVIASPLRNEPFCIFFRKPLAFDDASGDWELICSYKT